MSLDALDVIDRLPYELAARLRSDPYFADIPVVVADDGLIDQQIDKAQAAITTKGGKRGVAVIVLQMVGEDEFPNVNFGPMRLAPSFQVIENRELNRDSSGTGKSARQVARRIVDVIKPLRLAMMTSDFVPEKPAMLPVPMEQKKLVAYQVNFVCVEADGKPMHQVDQPMIGASEDGTQATLVCGTDGAEIWFTTDDSYPVPSNIDSTSTARVYVDPLDVPEAGLVLRACAYAPAQDMVASIVARAEIMRES